MSAVRLAGTWLPLVVAALFGLAWMDQEVREEPTWEFLALYGSGFVSLFFGTWALVQMARTVGGHPSFVLLCFIYDKALLAIVFAVIFVRLANTYVPWIPDVPEEVLYPSLAAAVTAKSVLNFALYFGRRRGWLEEPVDPVPFRLLFRRNR